MEPKGLLIDVTRCVGCGACVEACQFAALSPADGRMSVDPGRCHGCGICRAHCPEGALALRPA